LSNSANASQMLTSLCTWQILPMLPTFIYLCPTCALVGYYIYISKPYKIVKEDTGGSTGHLSNSANASQMLTSLCTWQILPMLPTFIYLCPTCALVGYYIYISKPYKIVKEDTGGSTGHLSNSANASQMLTSLCTWQILPMLPTFIYLCPTMYQNCTCWILYIYIYQNLIRLFQSLVDFQMS